MNTLKIGTTSYIIPGDLAANARYLAGRADHMQLVLFDVPNGPCNFPEPAEVRALRVIGDADGLQYTVHLPLDLHLGAADAPLDHLSLIKARAVIDATRDLAPVAYIAHLDGRELLTGPFDAHAHALWCEQTSRALEHVCDWIGDPALLAVENLELVHTDFIEVDQPERIPLEQRLDYRHLLLAAAVRIDIVPLVLRLNRETSAQPV